MNLRDKLKTLFQKINLRHPYIGAQIYRCYYGKIFNQITRKISGKNNRIDCGAAILLSVTFDIKGNDNSVQIGEGSKLNGVTFYVRGNNHKITIGKRCKFNRGGSLWCEDYDCSLIIGENSTFENVHIAVTEPGRKVVIGSDCMMAYDIDIRTGDSHSILSTETSDRINYAADISIGNHVWIAAHCSLLKGSTIAENSVVATGSVVTAKFPANVIIAGNPAKIIKRGITWSRKRVYKTT